MNPVIEVKNLSKKYEISHQVKANHSLRDQIGSTIRRPFGGGGHSTKEVFWALKDLSFTINQGEAVGIVGKNGSGKSTLLKILSRTVDPTTGEAILRGKVASLLEVGTGFHPELTGRENIYFNGSIIGMSKKEVTERFDEIVQFSEIEQFLDTPVKFYSSGMYVRLAFAVTANLDPDILIVDEVLAVGDAQFQEKCLDHMEKLFKQGKTILFVSHSMSLVRKLCQRAILLTKGVAKEYSNVDDLAADYLIKSGVVKAGKKVRVQAAKHSFSNFHINDKALNEKIVIPSGQPITIEAAYRNAGKPTDLLVGYAIKNPVTGDFPIFTHNKLEKAHHKTGKSGSVTAELFVPRLAPGNYSLEINVWLNNKMIVEHTEIGRFRILEVPAFSSKQILSSFPSSVLIDSNWSFSKK